MRAYQWRGVARGGHEDATATTFRDQAAPATRVPQDVLASVFCHHAMSIRDRAAARLVCQNWRSAIDHLIVRRLDLRHPGAGKCSVALLRRFPLLESVSLGSSVTSHRGTFTAAIAALPALNHLTHLSLEFASPNAISLPSTLHVLTHLRALSISVGCSTPLWGSGVYGSQGLGSGTGSGSGTRAGSGTGGMMRSSAYASGSGSSGAAASSSGAARLRRRGVAMPLYDGWAAGDDDDTDDPWDGDTAEAGSGDAEGTVSDPEDLDPDQDFDPTWSAGHRVLIRPGYPAVFTRGTAGVGTVAAGAGGAAGGGGPSAAAQLRRPPPGLLPLLSALSQLTSLELVHLAISVPDVLSAVRAAAAAGRRSAGAGGGSNSNTTRGVAEADCDSTPGNDVSVGGLQRLVLVGSGANLTGVGEPAAAAQLAQLQVLSLDSCTGADALMPLLSYLSGLRRLHLAGMDYAWAPAAGYHRRAGFNSSNDLQQHVNNPNGNNGLNGHNHNLGGHHHQIPGPLNQPLNFNGQPPFRGLGGLLENAREGEEWVSGGAAAAALAAVASGRPLAFLMCLGKLRSLSLAGSFLRTLPNRDIVGLTALTALDLSGNGLDDLPQGLLSLPLLRLLDVSQNDLVQLPPWLAQMQSLECLSCHHNGLERFPTLLYDLPRLSYLAIGHNRISWWPVESLLPRHRNHAEADDGNDAPAVHVVPAGPAVDGDDLPPAGPPAAAGAAAVPLPPQPPPPAVQRLLTPAPLVLPLASLDLSHNRLFGLPGGITSLGRLRCLRLRDCMTGMDGAGTARAMALLAGLTGLRELDLSSNHLDQHSIVSLSELRNLRQLWLADNGLEELPLGLAQLGRLKLLSLRANRFTEVPVCLRWLTSLEFLDLSCNRLSELPIWIGGPLPVLCPATLGNGYAGLDGSRAPPASGSHFEPRGSPSSAATDHALLKHPRQPQASQASASAGPVGPRAAGSEPRSGTRSRAHSHPGDAAPAAPPPQARPRGHHAQHAPHAEGLVGLRQLDVSQQYAVAVRESPSPLVPPRLEVQPPHCLYGPLQGDLPEELLRLPYLRTFVLQRHPLPLGSRVLRRLRARGVDVVHPRPLRVESLPGAAAAALTTAAAAGGLLFPGTHPGLRAASLAAAAAGRGGGGGGSALHGSAVIAAAAAVRRSAAASSDVSFLGPRESLFLLALVVVIPLGTAVLCSTLRLPPPPHVVLLVSVAASIRLALYGICLSKEAEARRQRQRSAALLAEANVYGSHRGAGGGRLQ